MGWFYIPQITYPVEQHFYITVNIDSCDFCNNTGIDGSGMYVEVIRGQIQQKHVYSVGLSVSTTVFERNHAKKSGGGICIVASRSLDLRSDPFWDIFDVTTKYNSNIDGDAFISLRVVESNFTRNRANWGSALHSDISLMFSRYFSLQSDLYILLDRGLNDRYFIDEIVNAAILIENSAFTENINTAVWTIVTKLYLSGQVMFVGNRGHSGGAFVIKKHVLLSTSCSSLLDQ